ncbi:MAG: hypothetical protein HFI64_09620 [Lachnospiraceae bacterium]|nr:hypothetical protein [Lachnospiraceae bacterium]
MGQKIGVDLGSTYSSFAVFDWEGGMPRTVTAVQGSTAASEPSVAVIDMSGNWQYGTAAKNMVPLSSLYPRIQVFRAFKMLLPENRKEILQGGGYSREHSPADVTRRYLDHYLSGILNRLDSPEDGREIEQLVICAPEIWGKDDRTQDGRAVLSDICKGFDYVKSVTVVSEPAAASAFFAFSFMKNTGKPFDGRILIIDYGGGTLDITLTQVHAEGGGKESLAQIRVLDSTGAGENQRDGKLGDAGIAYIHALCRLALEEGGVLEAGESPAGKEFELMFDFAEQGLKQPENLAKIRRQLKKYGDDFSEFAASSETVFSVNYGMTTVPVTYTLLNRAYEEAIAPVLREQLDLIRVSMDAHKVDYMDGDSDSFKIALVGGFGNFALVERQVREYFKFSAIDRRLKDIGAEMKEVAVSYGASLIADGAVKIRSTADRSLGIYSHREGSAEEICRFAILYRQDLEPYRIYPVLNEKGRPSVFLNSMGRIEEFGVSRGLDEDGRPRKPHHLVLKKSVRERLSHLPVDTYVRYGFSIDPSGIYYFHVEAQNDDTGEFEPFGEPIPLDRYNRLFENMIELDWDY